MPSHYALKRALNLPEPSRTCPLFIFLPHMRPQCRRRERQRRVIALGFTEDAFTLLDFAQLRTRRRLS
ncbi:hypothetical protein [Rhizobium leguminosarum]|uniref:hypothetical protein n=1 Tax=Rhizobium leguminosarum TaxID=384 RepID=UPI003ECF875F